MRAATQDPCHTSTIELGAVELPSLPWSSILLVAVGTFLAASVATRVLSHTGARDPRPSPGVDKAPLAVKTPGPPAVAAAVPVATHLPEVSERIFVDAPLFDVNRRELVVFTLPLDGALDDDLAGEVAHFMRCRRTGRERRMDPGVLAMLADLARQYPGHVIEIISAYRAKPYTTPQNRHRRGRAIDLRVRNVPLREVRNYLWTKYTTDIGLGYYPHSQFLHMDHRPDHNAIAWTQKRRNAPLRYHPWWAVKLRKEAARQHVSALSAPSPSRENAAPAAPAAT